MTARHLPLLVLFGLLPMPVEGQSPSAWWSLRPIARPPLPLVRHADEVQTPVDRFVLSELEVRGLRLVERADRRTLIRRATFDLTGLPPTPEEIDAFLSDSAPDAFARVVDRLLASPAYGERWGRHWLDVVRYADTAGDNSDYPVPQLFKYRDWVIQAVARDQPYDQFVREQLAGDLMTTDDPVLRRQRIIATGYLANSRRHGSYEDARYPWHLTIEDTIDNLGRTFLGMTIHCCRCHDHKFDPFTQADYYALYGFFSSTRYPWPGIELDKAPRDLVPLAPSDEVAAFEQERRAKLAEFDRQAAENKQRKSDAEQQLKDAEQAGDTKRIAEINRELGAIKAEQKLIQDRKERVQKQPVPYETAYAVIEGETNGKKKIGDARIQIKGDPEHLGPEVPRRFPTVLGGQTLPPEVRGSGRLILAQWLTDPANPLFARVMVNRIWAGHFGRGIVPTPGDFGKQGQPPSHPALLDDLAQRFMDSGWSVKAMHRLIMLSRTYQTASHDDESNRKIDPSNTFWWRYNRHRLDAESIRDSLLAVSGMLDRSPGGAHPFPDPTQWNFTQHHPFKAVYDHHKRSVYLMTQRIQRHPFLGLFDGADTNSATTARVTSTTPLQALYLMNDPFVHATTRQFARRIQAEGSNDAARVDRAFELLYGRPPLADERSAVLKHWQRARALLADHDEGAAWESTARAMLLSNEFVYVN